MTEEIQQIFSNHANTERAAAMSKYMRNRFPFLGIPAPLRRELSKSFIRVSKNIPEKELCILIQKLITLPEREYTYLALDILQLRKGLIPKDRITLLEKIACTVPWWDTIDPLATLLMGAYFADWPEEREKWCTRWKDSGDFWRQRCAILFQLKYKNQTDNTLLYKTISSYRHSDEFFLQKAIGWILREYGKTNPEWVVDVLLRNAFKPLSVREAMKHIGKKKVPASNGSE